MACRHIPKFGHVSEYMWDELCRLPYPHRIAYRVSALVRHCIEGLAPPLLRELCCPTTQVQRRRCLHSAAQAELIVPRSRTATRQRRTFSVAGPATCNGLPVTLHQYLLIAPSRSSLPSRPLCLTEAGLGALLSRQS